MSAAEESSDGPSVSGPLVPYLQRLTQDGGAAPSSAVTSERVGDAAPLQVPAVFGNVPPFPGETEWRGQIRPGTPEFTLPGWIEQAWPALDADAGLAQAVNAMYEGMRLEPEHPSLAHLTFVAAIEGYGMRLAADAPATASPAARTSRPPPRSDSARRSKRS